ncbi:hypothetical protein [Nocardia higoensis]|nr:hypothetical protein [Nocardia higoensis]
MAKAAKTREIRATMVRLAEAAKLPALVAHLTMQLHYQPRDNRRRDTDNLVATLKPLADAMAVPPPGKPHLGYGMVIDDTPKWMSKPEPIIHAPVKGEGGRLWLELSWVTERAA